jgi:hypothetical protein
MMKLIHESLLGFNVKCRASDPITRDTETPDVQFRLRIGGMDRRKVRFKGWVTIENFAYGDVQGSFVVMQRDEVIISALTDDIASQHCRIPGFTAVLATVVESVDQARRRQSARFKEIEFTPSTSHMIPTHTFITPTRRACLLYISKIANGDHP